MYSDLLFDYATNTFQARAFSNDVTAAVLVFQKHQKTATMLVFQTNPVGDDLFSYVSAFFRSKKSALMLATRVKTLHR